MSKILNLFHIALYRAQRYCRRNPKTIIMILTTLLVLIGAGLPRLQFLLAIDDLIDPDFKTYQSFKAVNEEFKDKNNLILLLKKDQAFQKQELCDLQTWVLNLVDRRKDIQQISTSFGVRQVQIKESRLSMRSVFDLNCDDVNDPESLKIEQAFQYVKNSPWSQILAPTKGFGLVLNFKLHDADERQFGTVNIKGAQAIEEDYVKSVSSQIKAEPLWAGFLVYQQELRKALDQTQALNGLLFIFSLLVFRFFLKSWKAGFVFNGTVLVAMILVYGAMGYLSIPMDVLTNAIGIMLMVSCLEDFVFVAYGILSLNWSFRKSLRRFLIPSFYTSLTTFIGFGSLIFSDLAIVRRFGFISALATMIEWLIVFLVLPSCLVYFKKARILQIKPSQVQNKLLAKVSLFKTHYVLSLFLTISVLISLLFSDQLHVKDSPDAFFSANHKSTIISNRLRAEMGWITDISLVFASTNSEQQNRDIIKKFKTIEFIKKIESPFEVSDFLLQEIPSELKDTLKRQWEASPFSGRLISDTGKYRAQLYVPNMEMDEVTQLIKQSQKICPHAECELVGALVSYNEFGDRVLQTLFSSLGASLLLVVGLIYILGRKLHKKTLFFVVLASMWGPLALLAVFILFKIPLFFVSSICASVLVGIAGDNAIQFIFYKKSKNPSGGVNVLAPASLIITLGMILFSCVFLVSILQPLMKLGYFIILGFVFGFIGDVTILRGFLKDEK